MKLYFVSVNTEHTLNTELGDYLYTHENFYALAPDPEAAIFFGLTSAQDFLYDAFCLDDLLCDLGQDLHDAVKDTLLKGRLFECIMFLTKQHSFTTSKDELCREFRFDTDYLEECLTSINADLPEDVQDNDIALSVYDYNDAVPFDCVNVRVRAKTLPDSLIDSAQRFYQAGQRILFKQWDDQQASLFDHQNEIFFSRLL